MQPIYGTVGAPQNKLADGVPASLRFGGLSDLIVSQLNARYGEAALRGMLFSGGMGLTSISNVTFTTATLGVTCTPIAGVWNPVGSGKNLLVLAAMLGVTVTAATNTGGGPFAWASSVASTAQPATGAAPFNRLTGLATGSVAKDMAGAALTGATGNLAVRCASALNGGSAAGFSFVGTAVGQFTPAGGQNLEIFDGGWIVPPGGILALLATTTPVAHSAVSGLLWMEQST